jgi:hypothetical protein
VRSIDPFLSPHFPPLPGAYCSKFLEQRLSFNDAIMSHSAYTCYTVRHCSELLAAFNMPGQDTVVARVPADPKIELGETVQTHIRAPAQNHQNSPP